MVSPAGCADYYTVSIREAGEAGEEAGERGRRKCIVTLRTNRDGCWTPASPDDKATLPGRPPIHVFPDRQEEYCQVEAENVVITPLFVLIPLEGTFSAGEVTEFPFTCRAI